MPEKDVFLTAKGLAELEEELDQAKSVKRREISERIKEALAFGDISENAEYDQAKNDQAQLEERIAKLETMLSNAKLIDENDIKKDKVSIGSKVLVYDMEFEEDMELEIVGSVEANPSEGKISNESPVGAALLGSKVGDIVNVVVPDGTAQYEIKEINR